MGNIIYKPPFFFWKNWSLIRFFKPKCEICKNYSIIFSKISNTFSNELDFIDINCDKYKSFCLKKSIYGVPSLILYNSNNNLNFFFKNNFSLINILFFIQNFTGIKPINKLKNESTFLINSINEGKCTIILNFLNSYPKFIENSFELFQFNDEIDFYYLKSFEINKIFPNLNFSKKLLLILFTLSNVHILENFSNSIDLYYQINDLCFGKERNLLKIFLKNIIFNNKITEIPEIFLNIYNTLSFKLFVLESFYLDIYLLKYKLELMRKKYNYNDLIIIKILILIIEIKENV